MSRTDNSMVKDHWLSLVFFMLGASTDKVDANGKPLRWFPKSPEDALLYIMAGESLDSLSGELIPEEEEYEACTSYSSSEQMALSLCCETAGEYNV